MGETNTYGPADGVFVRAGDLYELVERLELQDDPDVYDGVIFFLGMDDLDNEVIVTSRSRLWSFMTEQYIRLRGGPYKVY